MADAHAIIRCAGISRRLDWHAWRHNCATSRLAFLRQSFPTVKDSCQRGAVAWTGDLPCLPGSSWNEPCFAIQQELQFVSPLGPGTLDEPPSTSGSWPARLESQPAQGCLDDGPKGGAPPTLYNSSSAKEDTSTYQAG